MANNYEIGHGKPPRANAFKKGKSGNPKGRPKGHRNLKTDLLEVLSDRITVVEQGSKRRLTKQQALLKRTMNDALQGDAKARALILNLASNLERSGDLVPATQPTNEQDSAILQRLAARLNRQAN
jgi:hypothetical protein